MYVSQTRPLNLDNPNMPAVLVDFAKNLKIDRFTIDVLTQRLAHLKQPPGQWGSEEYERFLGATNESVTGCVHLHNYLRERFCRVETFDVRSIASMSAGFEDLHRRLMESIANLNLFEFGTDVRPNALDPMAVS